MQQNITRRPRLFRLAGTLLLLAPLAAGCGAERDRQPRLTGGTETLDELGHAVWAAIVRSDTAALDRLRLSQFEHDELVWPEQPAAREPSAAANLDLWWNNIQLRNDAAVRDLLRRHAGSTRTLAGVECAGETRDYASFQALGGCRLLLAGPTGPEPLEAFRYVIRMDGRHKVVRFYEDR